MTTNSSHSAANLMNVTPVCDRLSDSVLQNGHGAWTTGPQPIPFPESFVPRATPGPNGSIIDFETEWLEIAFAQNALGNEYRPGFTSRIPPSGADKKIDRTTEFLSTISHGSSGADRTGVQELQWLVASGSRLAELVCQWHHRARNNLHFFPVPCSPFEFPSLRSHSNPLRHPVFVPCRLDRLASAFDTAQRDHQYRLDMTVSKTPILDVTYVANQLFRALAFSRLHTTLVSTSDFTARYILKGALSKTS
ncbi:hypothetical protein FGIG_01838 [Fasciola gigantica]|uniref:DEPDC5 C-terminal domain-containing protein n=1 Tax=Fasciola gigantica TaxID=46835 RepID=A0A504YY72_FASGI|nr:hypothetical protein FGIG_01838 [Fasciola gigantica]